MGKRISSREFAGAWIRIAGAETRRWRPAGEKGRRLVPGPRADAEARHQAEMRRKEVRASVRRGVRQVGRRGDKDPS